MNKEQVYDEQIAPLMTRVIEICKEHKIAHVMSFSIPNDEDDGLCCTTGNISDDFELPEHFVEAMAVLGPHKSSALMVITTKNVDGKIIQSTAVLG